MSNTWLNNDNIELLDIITEEYTPAQKKQLGIPANATARGGSWFVGSEYVGKVVKGKFVPAKKVQKPKVVRTKQTNDRIGDGRRIEQRAPIKSKDWGQLIQIIKKQEGIPELSDQETEILENEARKHGQLIEKNKELDQMVTAWMVESIWRQPKQDREDIFYVLENKFKKHNLQITAKELYRGVHGYKKSDKYVHALVKHLQSNSVIKLPPAGFSYDIGTAMTFANPAEPIVSVLFILTPKEKKKLQGLHISWKDQHHFVSEREVITRAGNYKVLGLSTTNIVYEGYDVTNITARIEQE